MHEALIALRRARDIRLFAGGFDRAREMGVLGSYMDMLDRGGSGRYGRKLIVAAKMHPGKDPMLMAERKSHG